MRAILAAAALASGVVLPGGHHQLPMTCAPRSYAVTVGQGDHTTMTGQLCSRGPARTEVITMPGSTYTDEYFSWPQDPARYSFAYAATAAGMSVLTLNELGTPPGPQPPAADLTITANAQALQQVIKTQHAPRIFGAGHSVGSYIWWVRQQIYGDAPVRGLVITGALHPASAAGRTLVSSSIEPAAGMPAGYLTTRPGTRAGDFYAPGDYDPSVVAQDERTKGITSGPTLAGIAAAEAPAVTQSIKIPVLTEVGSEDTINCLTSAAQPSLPCGSSAAVWARERPDYGGPLTAFVLPGSGHDLTTELNGWEATAAAVAWMAVH